MSKWFDEIPLSRTVTWRNHKEFQHCCNPRTSCPHRPWRQRYIVDFLRLLPWNSAFVFRPSCDSKQQTRNIKECTIRQNRAHFSHNKQLQLRQESIYRQCESSTAVSYPNSTSATVDPRRMYFPYGCLSSCEWYLKRTPVQQWIAINVQHPIHTQRQEQVHAIHKKQ